MSRCIQEVRHGCFVIQFRNSTCAQQTVMRYPSKFHLKTQILRNSVCLSVAKSEMDRRDFVMFGFDMRFGRISFIAPYTYVYIHIKDYFFTLPCCAPLKYSKEAAFNARVFYVCKNPNAASTQHFISVSNALQVTVNTSTM